MDFRKPIDIWWWDRKKKLKLRENNNHQRKTKNLPTENLYANLSGKYQI